MGGINPPAPTDELMSMAQHFTLALCSINQHFWNGHSEIERMRRSRPIGISLAFGNEGACG